MDHSNNDRFISDVLNGVKLSIATKKQLKESYVAFRNERIPMKDLYVELLKLSTVRDTDVITVNLPLLTTNEMTISLPTMRLAPVFINLKRLEVKPMESKLLLFNDEIEINLQEVKTKSDSINLELFPHELTVELSEIEVKPMIISYE